MSPAPTTRDGMGSVLYDGGVAFRVWAPHAERVSVVGSFNGWHDGRDPLAPEGGGYWSGEVASARAGDEYKYILRVGEHAIWRSDPYARELTDSQGNSVVHDPDFPWRWGDYRTPEWNELVIYELHVGTFNDEPGGDPGDLESAIDRLPHLRRLGINAIELMPPAEFAGEFSWGYNPAHIFAVESAYGGPRAFKRFVNEAHARDIAVIVDVVFNHLGPQHLDLWQFDGWQEDGKGGIYFYNDSRSWTPWADTRPDYGRPEVRQYLRDNVRFWIEECGVDGLRVDATAFIRNTYGHQNDPSSDIADGWRLLQEINEEVDARQPWKIVIAEDLRDNASITKSAAESGAGFDAQWDAGFVHPVRNALIAPDDGARDMFAVRDAIYRRYDADAFERVIYTESHDEVANGKARVPEEISPGEADSWWAKKRSTLGAALVFTAPGIPMIFQGQEILRDEWFRDIRPIDWQEAHRFCGIRNLYRDLIRLRRNVDGMTRGLLGQHVRVHHVNNADKVIAFHRWDVGGAGDDVVVILNFADRAYESYRIGLPHAGAWKVRFNSDWGGYDPAFGGHASFELVADRVPADGMPSSGSVGIGPYTAVVLSQDVL